MKKLVYILVLMVMACGVACCNRYGEAEARLVAIDSLVCDQPDSALSLLADINGDSLPTDLQAYHSLLTVQALYKAYIPATSDTLIRRAWDYYRDHGPYDRRIRAMLYMGTVAEELGHPDSAMRWYKRTELESRPDDHYHRGYALMSMAYLYQFQYIAYEKAIKLHKNALDNFLECNDKHCQLICLTEIGRLFRLTNTDSALCYSNKGVQLALEMNDSSMYFENLASQAGAYYSIKDWNNTLRYAMPVIKSDYINDNQDCIFFASQSYLYEGKIDSALYYLQHSRPILTKDSILYFRTRSLIEEKQGNYFLSGIDAEKAGSIADSSIIANNKYNLSLAEKEYPTFVLENDNHALQKSNNGLKYIILLCGAIIASLVIFFRYRIRSFNEQLAQQRENLDAAHQQLQELHNDLSEQMLMAKADQQKLINLRADCIKTVFQNTIYSGVRGASIFKHLFDLEKASRKSLISIHLPASFWEELNHYFDLAYPNAFETLKNEGFELRDKDKRLIMLDCIGVPNAVIEHILGYGGRSLSPIKSKLISKIGKGETDINKILQKYSDK